MSISNLYPSIAPSLSLDFSNVKALDPRISFVRTTTATYYGTDTAKAEENLFLRSQELDAAAWTVTRASITANATTAPDGTTTAEKLVEDTTAANTHSVQQAVTLTPNTHAVSVFAKKSEKNFLSISTFLSTSARTFFNLDAGTVGTTAAGHTASIVNVGNGWYRCIVVFTATAASWSMRFEIAEADNDVTIDGNGTDGIFLWGCQLEQRSAATNYTPTTTQPITNYIPVLEVAAAGEARFDHNPLTFESLGLLVEEQRTNQILRSEEYDNASWTKTRASITANTVVAPDGTLTGDKLVEDTTASNSHIVTQASLSFTSGTSHTLSVYVKAAGRTGVRILLPTAAFGANVSYNFFLDTATFAQNTAGTNDSASITSVGNGWFRCTVTAQATATSTGTIQFLLLDGASASYTGNGFSGIFIWGAQLEAGAFPTSYIKTVAATVTRNADAASMTGTNFSSWYRADEGTLYAEASPQVSNAVSYLLFEVNNATALNRIGLFKLSTTGNASMAVLVNNVTQVSTNNGAWPASGKFAGAYAVNNFASVLNGGSASTNTNAILPVVTQATIGVRADGANILNGHLRKIAYYPARLSNAQLQALTTV